MELALQPYQFTVEHRAGRLNGNADALSRAAANQFAAGEGGRSVRVCDIILSIVMLF